MNVKLDMSSKDYLDSLQKLEEKDGEAPDGETKAADGEGDDEEKEPEYDEEMDEEEGDYQLDYYNEDMDLVGGDSDGGGNEDY